MHLSHYLAAVMDRCDDDDGDGDDEGCSGRRLVSQPPLLFSSAVSNASLRTGSDAAPAGQAAHVQPSGEEPEL